MIKLTIGNSISQVEGLSLEQHKSLRDILSYEADPQSSYFSGNHRSNKRYLITSKGAFPSGLLYLVEKFLQPLPHNTVDTRVKPKPTKGLFSFKGNLTPRKEQLAAAQAAALYHRGCIEMPTGSGKSVVIAMILEHLQVRTLIVVPSLELKVQLTESMKSWFGKNKVGKGKDIYINNVQSLDPKEPLVDYDCVIIDEVHHSGAKTYRQLNTKAWNNVYYKIGLTATFFRSQPHERLLLESVLSKVIYKLDYKSAVENEYILPVEAFYYELPKREVEGYTWAQVYKELVTHNEDRNRLIANVIATLDKAGAYTLTLVKEIEHGQKLADLTGVGFVSGVVDNTRELILEFVLHKRTSLIGTTGVLGEGVDSRPAEYIIIAGLGRSKGNFMQQVGRGMRVTRNKESCKVILFKDPSHKFTLRHFKEQCKILLEEYGVKPVKLKN